MMNATLERRAYRRHKRAAAGRQAEISAAGRELGPLPAVVDPARRARCARKLRAFCEEYFPRTYSLPWSADHLKVIAKVETAVLMGGLFAMAMPRGSGKTSLVESATLWAVAYGHRAFPVAIGADAALARSMLESIKREIETNDRLAEDFPEVCYPVRALEGIHQRAGGQTYRGAPTHIVWTADSIVLPMIPGSRAAGAVIAVAGLTGRIRGLKVKTADGRSLRPDLVLLDDPQTDESARSPSQCATRERILSGAILGLAGPGKKIAGLMTLTVVYPDDMADRILDRGKHPVWQGARTRMLYAPPSNTELWEQYAQLRAEGLRNETGTAGSTAFYAEHREAMDAGAAVAWPERFHADELSAVQHAMNLRFDRGEAAFAAEYQNEPLPEHGAAGDLPTAEELLRRTNGQARGRVPLECTRLTAFVDVQARLLYWIVAGWDDGFGGAVLDYGTEPEQKTPGFTAGTARQTLQRAAGNCGLEAAIYAGLERLCDRLLGREWLRADGSNLRIERLLIDANWGEQTDTVYKFCRESPHAALLLPSHGRYVGAAGKPFGEWQRRPGERAGLNWRIPLSAGKRAVRHALFDTNWWKSFVIARLITPIGDRGALTFWGPRGRSGELHRPLVDQLTAEFRVRTEGRGRTVDEWKIKKPGLDNHWWDGLVGCAVAASVGGSALLGPAPVRKRVRFSELQAQKRGAR